MIDIVYRESARELKVECFENQRDAELFAAHLFVTGVEYRVYQW